LCTQYKSPRNREDAIPDISVNRPSTIVQIGAGSKYSMLLSVVFVLSVGGCVDVGGSSLEQALNGIMYAISRRTPRLQAPGRVEQGESDIHFPEYSYVVYNNIGR
jgi:hypothetical protein